MLKDMPGRHCRQSESGTLSATPAQAADLTVLPCSHQKREEERLRRRPRRSGCEIDRAFWRNDVPSETSQGRGASATRRSDPKNRGSAGHFWGLHHV